MKKNTQNKTLTLSKETVQNLDVVNKEDMGSLKGGSQSDSTVNTIIPIICG